MEAEKTFFFLNAAHGNQMVEVAVYPGRQALALLIILGQGGSVDGYRNKYQIIASNLVKDYDANVFVVENHQLLEKDPQHFVTSAMEFVEETMICFGFEEWETFAMGNSAGGLFLASCLDHYPQISRLLLVNPVLSFNFEQNIKNLADFQGQLTLIQGSEDGEVPLYPLLKEALSGKQKKILILKGVDHEFKNPGGFEEYLKLPEKYLFYDKIVPQ